ncbi:MAG: DUF3500 domain-containing protein [Gemmatimonadota bacterium]
MERETLAYAEAPVASADGEDRTLRLDLYRPAGSERASGRPVVLLMHGGGFVGGGRDLPENRELGRALASRGYVAASIDYRLMSDRPVLSSWARDYASSVVASEHPVVRELEERHGPEWSSAVGAAAEDLLRAIEWVRREGPRYGIDPGSVAVLGMSAGAVTANALAYRPRAAGVRDPRLSAVVSVRGGLLDPAAGASVNPADAPPLFIAHGTDDQRLRLSEALRLYETAKAADIPVELHPIEGAGHELGGSGMLRTRLQDGSRLVDRLDAFLRAAFENPTSLPSAACVGTGAGCPGSAAPRSDANRAPDLSARAPDPSAREEMVVRAEALIAAVDEGGSVVEDLFDYDRVDELLLDFDDPARRDWSYWPRPRAGLALGRMTAAQRGLVHDLLAAHLSSLGYLAVGHVMRLEDVLGRVETVGFPRGADRYTVALFGEPTDLGVWGWRFEGHHVSLNVTLTPDEVSVTPTFLGASPAELSRGPHAGFRPVRHVRDLARDLFLSLRQDQVREALLTDSTPGGLLSSQFGKEPGDWDEWRTLLRPDGTPASEFDARQSALLERLLEQIVGLYRPTIADAYRADLRPDELWFAWMGARRRGAPQYFRLQGESFVFEFDASQEDGDHVHMVWRDRDGDFGDAALHRHYRDHEH